MANLFVSGDFKLHSGSRSKWKIDCDALTDEDWETLAQMIVERVPPFGFVEGVPSGGLKLAQVLRKYQSDGSRKCLIVDDVLTTGTSMETWRIGRDENEVVGAVVFARGLCPEWIVPLFQMGKR